MNILCLKPSITSHNKKLLLFKLHLLFFSGLLCIRGENNMLFQENKISCSNLSNINGSRLQRDISILEILLFHENRNSMDFPCSAWTRLWIKYILHFVRNLASFLWDFEKHDISHLALHPFRLTMENIFSKLSK